MVSLVASKKVTPSAVITDRMPLEKGEEAFQKVIRGESGKVIFKP